MILLKSKPNMGNIISDAYDALKPVQYTITLQIIKIDDRSCRTIQFRPDLYYSDTKTFLESNVHVMVRYDNNGPFCQGQFVSSTARNSWILSTIAEHCRKADNNKPLEYEFTLLLSSNHITKSDLPPDPEKLAPHQVHDKICAYFNNYNI